MQVDTGTLQYISSNNNIFGTTGSIYINNDKSLSTEQTQTFTVTFASSEEEKY